MKTITQALSFGLIGLAGAVTTAAFVLVGSAVEPQPTDERGVTADELVTSDQQERVAMDRMLDERGGELQWY